MSGSDQKQKVSMEAPAEEPQLPARSPINQHLILPLQLELESISTYKPPVFTLLPPPTVGVDTLKPHIGLEVDYEANKFPLSYFGFSGLDKHSPVKNLHIEEVFPHYEPDQQEGPEAQYDGEEANKADPQAKGEAKRGKKGQAGKKKKPSIANLCIQVDENEKTLNFRLNRKNTFDGKPREETQPLAKNKSRSEPTTEDSLSPQEFQGFPGLAGSTPYFRKSKCTACKNLKLVFWFGDSEVRRRADKFLCLECLKAGIGESKITEIVTMETKWNMSNYREDLFVKRCSGLKEPKKFELTAEKPEEDCVVLNNLLEAKHTELQWLLNKMINCLNLCKDTCNPESSLLALRFINDTIDLLMKAGHLQKLPTFSRKLDSMDQTEQKYFRSEVSRLVAQNSTYHQRIASRKCSEDLTGLLTHPKAQVATKKHSFFIDMDEKPQYLGKRDPKKEMFEDFEEHYHFQPVKAIFEDGLAEGEVVPPF